MIGRTQHLLVSLTPHGYGHAAMTAPVVNALRRRLPGLRLTLQSAAPESWLRARYDGEFALIADCPDIGARMNGPLHVDVAATAAAYARLHADYDRTVAGEAARFAALAPDLVLSNISYVAVAAARRAGIPAMALSCLNWWEIYRHYCGDRPEAPAILSQIAEAYAAARVVLRAEPAMPMLPTGNRRTIGPVARRAPSRRAEVAQRLGLDAATRLGVVGFGGIDLPLPFAAWPRLEGWHWLMPEPVADRPDLTHWREAGLPFNDLLVSADVMVTKPGYGTFAECAVNGVPVLYVERPGWPESPCLEDWLKAHGRCLGTTAEALFGGALAGLLRTLFSLPPKALPEATGVAEAVEELVRALAGDGVPTNVVETCRSGIERRMR